MVCFLFVLSAYTDYAQVAAFTDTKFSCSKYETASTVTFVWCDPEIAYRSHTHSASVFGQLHRSHLSGEISLSYVKK